jgi:hypothetical protein
MRNIDRLASLRLIAAQFMILLGGGFLYLTCVDAPKGFLPNALVGACQGKNKCIKELLFQVAKLEREAENFSEASAFIREDRGKVARAAVAKQYQEGMAPKLKNDRDGLQWTPWEVAAMRATRWNIGRPKAGTTA